MTPEDWANEGIAKYGDGAEDWLRRWMVNCQNHPDEIAELEGAIQIVRNAQGGKDAEVNLP